MKKATIASCAIAAVLITPMMSRAHDGAHGPSAPLPTSVPEVRTGKTTGRVVQIDENTITVETIKKNQALKATYLIDQKTKTKGSPEVGQDVVVKYREERTGPVATNIEVKKAKSPTAVGEGNLSRRFR